jgi:hypothetical protein
LFIYTAEVYPTTLRSTGLGIASSVSRIAGIITSFVSEDASLSVAFVTFCLLSLCATLAAKSLPIETAFRSMEDVGPDERANNGQYLQNEVCATGDGPLEQLMSSPTNSDNYSGELSKTES